MDKYFETNIRPGFIGDFLSREHVLPGGIKIDATTFPGEEAIQVKVGADAAANAVTVTVVALSDAIPSGTVINLGAKKFVKLTADAAKNAVTLTVEALPTALVTGDIGYYTPTNVPKRIAAGRLVGLTYAQLSAGAATGVKWHKALDTDDIVRIIAYDVKDAIENDDADVLRPGTLIYMNFLPGYADLSATLKGKLQASYEISVGAPGQEVAYS